MGITLLIIFLAAFAGSFVQSVAGFGFIIVCMSIFPQFLPVDQSLVLSQIGGVVVCIWLLWGKTGRIRFRYTAFPVAFVIIGSVLGLYFLKSLVGTSYMRVLGAILFLLALWMLRFADRVRIRPTDLNGAITGTLGGIMGSLFGIGTPPLILYFQSNSKDKDDYMVPLQITLCIQTMTALTGRALLGMWPTDILLPSLPLLAGLFLGKIPGKLLYGKLDLRTMRFVIYLLIAAIGLYTFLFE
jgi:uncharacterized membrane protein YfcA